MDTETIFDHFSETYQLQDGSMLIAKYLIQVDKKNIMQLIELIIKELIAVFLFMI